MTLFLGYTSDVLMNVFTFPLDTVVNGSIKEGIPWHSLANRLLSSSSPISKLYGGFSAKLLGGFKPAIQFLLLTRRALGVLE